MEITKETLLADLIGLPEAEEILAKFEVPCLSCPHAQYEMGELQIGFICETYDIDCEKLLADLNKALNKPDE
jgi:hypothetical protein